MTSTVRILFFFILLSVAGGCSTFSATTPKAFEGDVYSNTSFRVYNTPSGTANILKGVLESLHAQKVSYIKLYDGGYRFFYRSAECNTSIECEEFTVTVKPDGKATQSVVSITGLGGRLERETVRTVYYEVSKFSRTSSLFAFGDEGVETQRRVYEITFTADAQPSEVVSWTYNILQEMKMPQRFIHIRKLGNVFYRLTYRDEECETHKKRYKKIKELLKLDEGWCGGFIMDAGRKGSSTMIQVYATDRYLPFDIVNGIYLRLSDIVKTANYTEDF